MKILVDTAFLQAIMGDAGYKVLNQQEPVSESYEIAKLFNTPTHQVVMLKTFEEIDADGDYSDFVVSYNTSYQVTQIMFHNGVRVARSFGYAEEANRDAYWAKVGQQQAQEFVDATVKFIASNSDEDSGK